ncbi:MAG: acyltransferase [Nocardiopsaceae bacterium]|nr:acyltransferase [Nocardiopsaceae bacterium]
MSAIASAQPGAADPPSSATGQAPSAQQAQPKRSGARLAWLDALRGFAALCVVFDHASYHVLEPARLLVYRWIDPGQYGVFVFFLVSGYIIPASLERKGSVRSFWISRAFRLYPLYLIALALSLVGLAHGWWQINGVRQYPLVAAASWLVMMPDVLSAPNTPIVVWTLSFEMAFYLIVAALFSWRAHKPSGGYALAFATGAVALGGILPMWWLYRAAGGRPGTPGSGHAWILDVTADALIVGGVAVAVVASRRAGSSPMLARIGASVAALTALILVNVNAQYPYPWSGCTILALMFTGTLIYRAEQGQVRKVKALVISLAVLALTLAAGLWHGESYGSQWQVEWVMSLVGAAVTFAIGMAVRHRKIPAPLAWLGLVSYSVYLLHPLIVDTYVHLSERLRGASMGVQVVIALGLLGAVLLVSAISYYGVEKPMQKAGRWIATRTSG